MKVQYQKGSNTAVSLEPTPARITTHKSWNPAALTEQLASTSVGGQVGVFYRQPRWSDPSLRSLSVSVSSRQLGWFKNTFWQSLLLI